MNGVPAQLCTLFEPSAGSPRADDDINEFFWSREAVDTLLPQGDGADKQSFGLNATLAYGELRTKMREAAMDESGVGVRHALLSRTLHSASPSRPSVARS